MASFSSRTWLAAAGVVLGGISLQASAYTAVYAFGDSLSDTGNLFAATTGLHQINPQAPVLPQTFNATTGGYLNGRFSNGPVAVEVLAQRLGATLYSGAYGGATSGLGPTYSSPFGALNTGLQAQLSSYAASGGADANALYFLWIGSNDIRDGLDALNDPTKSLQQKQAALFGAVQSVGLNLASGLQQLYDQGARHFLVPLQPDFGLTPEGRGAQAALDVAGIPFSLSSFSDGVNAALGQALGAANLPLPGASLMLWNPVPLQRAVVANPSAYGIGSVTTPCFSGYVGLTGSVCAEGLATNAMFWDKVHPSAITHQILGEAMAAAVPEPATMLSMALGLAALLAIQRRRRA